MSVSSVGGSGSTSASAILQKKLITDQKRLAADRAAKVSQQILTLDQSRITSDSAALAALTKPQSTTSATSTASAASPIFPTSAKKVDLYL
jgi:hypothetical protein